MTSVVTPLAATEEKSDPSTRSRFACLLVLLVASLIYLPALVSPPHLMDDVDAVQAQIARNMLVSGDYVTARLDGVAYLEKSPLIYWLMVGSFRVFGVHDWAARIPISAGAIALSWLTYEFAAWAFGTVAGAFAGIAIAASTGLYLFTRVLIPDVLLTLCIALSLYCLMRALEPEETRHWVWSGIGAAGIAAGLLLKGLIAAVFPVGIGFLFLMVTGEWLRRETWRRLHPFAGTMIILAIALPWHVLATIRNPPYFNFSMVSRHGEYHGFFWFYFFNEHLLRFLNRRYPHDYNTVPLGLFWLFNVLWLFPFIVYLPGVFRERFLGSDRASRVRLLSFCWIAVVMVFFSFSTTQEYYSMPIYPAVALLIGSGCAVQGKWHRVADKLLAILFAGCGIACLWLLWAVRHVTAQGDISRALTIKAKGGIYTYSLGHALDLTLYSFAYLRLPLFLAGLAFIAGAVLISFWGHVRVLALSLTMILFFAAAHLAMNVFDPYLSSHPLAETLRKSPPGTLISDGAYYSFSSVVFYADRAPLILDGRTNNLVYGSFAPGAPNIFIEDDDLKRLWDSNERFYLITAGADLSRIRQTLDNAPYFLIAESGSKYLLSNQSVDTLVQPAEFF